MAIPPDHVYRFALTGVNAYLVDDGEVTLVDAGTPWDAERLEGRLAAAGYDPTDVDRVLVTHYDLDHVGTLAALPFDASVWAASPDADYLAGEATSPLAPHKPLLQRLGSLVTPTPDLPVERVGDRDAVGGFAVHRAPGHTPGHTAYVHEEFGVAFVGDMLRTVDGALRPSPWLATHDPSENGASVSRVAAALLPDGPEAVAVGHGDPVREGAADALARLRRERHGGSTGVES